MEGVDSIHRPWNIVCFFTWTVVGLLPSTLYLLTIDSRSNMEGIRPLFLMSDFVPTDDQTNNLIHPAWEEIRSSAEELQKDLGCDKEYIRQMLVAISDYFA